MRLLIDTNLAITYATGRETDPDKDAAIAVIDMCAEGKAEGYLAMHSVSNMWYILKNMRISDGGARAFTEKEVRQKMRDVCVILSAVGVGSDEVLSAIDNEDFADFEDCLQEQCGITAEVDYIVTSNIADFKASGIPAITPRELLNELSGNQ